MLCNLTFFAFLCKIYKVNFCDLLGKSDSFTLKIKFAPILPSGKNCDLDTKFQAVTVKWLHAFQLCLYMAMVYSNNISIYPFGKIDI